MKELVSKVYIKTDSQNRIIRCKGGNDIPTSLFGWTLIDEGTGDKYSLCGSNYFDGGLYNDDGIPRYKLVDGASVLRSEEEIEADRLPDLDTLREAKQAANKKALADWLAAHPLTWTDGNVYGTTKEDQDEMALNYMQYQLAVSANQPAVLEWHTQKKRCYTFSVEDFTALSLDIAAYVYPYLRYQEAVKEAIYMAQSKEELDAIEIDYGSVGAAA